MTDDELLASLSDLESDTTGRTSSVRDTETYLPSSVSPDVLSENDREYEQKLSSLRLLSPDAGSTLTVVGLLTIGRDPLRFVPGAYIQFLRIDGQELTDPIRDHKAIDGPIPRLIEQMDDVLKAHISVSSDFTIQRFTRYRDVVGVQFFCPPWCLPISSITFMSFSNPLASFAV